MDHPGVNCNKCNTDIVGFRYKCVECNDFDLCRFCESDYHSGHVLMRFADPLNQSDITLVKNIMDRRSHDKPFLIQGTHDNEQCNECGREHITDFLYKCIDCLNFNLCRHCEKRNSKCITGKNHILARFADPLCLNSFNKRFWQEILEIRTSIRESNDEQGLISEPTSELIKHEGAKCDSCQNDIVGLLFKCVDCQDYELCSHCEPKNVHSGHLFVRFAKAIELVTEIFFDGLMQLRSNLRNKVKDHSIYPYSTISWTMNHSGITCDNCKTTIHGFRYKCLDCTDFDLCSFCQKKGYHAEHLMFRFTEPLDVNNSNQHFVQFIMNRRVPDDSLAHQEWPLTTFKTNAKRNNNDQSNFTLCNISHGFPAPQGKAIPNCTICCVMPSEMILLDCGHLCICSFCIDDYFASTPQCPLCRLPVKSSHRAHY